MSRIGGWSYLSSLLIFVRRGFTLFRMGYEMQFTYREPRRPLRRNSVEEISTRKRSAGM